MSRPDGTPDAELVAGVLAGDREAFAGVYDRYADRLHDFAWSMLRHREEAADAVADSFVLMAEKVGQLRDPDRLRPWLYSVVRHECLRRLRARSRVAYDGEDRLMEMPDAATGPDREAEVAALRTLVWDAAAGLGERDRALLDLHLRHGLEGAELGEAMGISAANAYTSLNRLRTQVERSLGALLIARLGRDDCADLGAILAEWDGRFSPLVRKRVARHVDGCDACERRRSRMVSPWALLAGVPLLAAPAGLREHVLEDSRMVAHYAPPGGGPRSGAGAGAGSGAAAGAATRRRAALAAGGGVLAAAVVALLVLLVPDRDAALTDAAGTADPSAEAVTVGPPVPTAAPPATEPPGPTPAPSSPSSAPVPADSTEESGTPAGTGGPAPAPPAPPAPPDPVVPDPVEPGTAGPAGPAPGGPGTATPAVPPPLPAALAVSTRLVDLGTALSTGTVTLTNTGGQPLDYQLTPPAGWASVSPASGSIPGGASQALVVTLDRANLPIGSSRTAFTVGWGGAPASVAVLATMEAPIR